MQLRSGRNTDDEEENDTMPVPLANNTLAEIRSTASLSIASSSTHTTQMMQMAVNSPILYAAILWAYTHTILTMFETLAKLCKLLVEVPRTLWDDIRSGENKYGKQLPQITCVFVMIIVIIALIIIGLPYVRNKEYERVIFEIASDFIAGGSLMLGL